MPPGIYTRRAPELRFWAKVDKSAGPDGCWPWLGRKNASGYGDWQSEARTASCDGTRVRAHRYAYTASGGFLAADQVLRHLCNNPVCCNPAHLAPGTHADNVADKVAAGRQPRGSGHPSSKLDESDVRLIRLFASCGQRSAAISTVFGVSRRTISKIVARGGWFHV